MTEVEVPRAGGPPETAGPSQLGFAARLLATAGLVVSYYWYRGQLVEWANAVTSAAVDLTILNVVAVVSLLAALFLLWRPVIVGNKKLYAPILITVILALGDTGFGVLENHPAPPWLVKLSDGLILEYSPTFITMAITVLTELVLGRFMYRRWPNPTSAYISGISAGILIKSPELWPFALCGMISITSKYILRLENRHLWNPTNFGITAMLFLAPQHVASLSVQAGNNGWALVVIWVLGGMIMYNLGRFHIPLAFVSAFIPLAFLRSFVTGDSWQTEIAPLTSPMFQLYIFFMITDPPTTTRAKWSQTLTAVMVAVMETVYRLAFKDVHSLYHALFTVGPIANVIEIYAGRLKAKPAGAKGVSGTPPLAAVAGGLTGK